MVLIGFSCFFGFPMVFMDFPMIFIGRSIGFPFVFLHFSMVFIDLVFLWFYMISPGFSLVFISFPMVVIDFSMVFIGFSTVSVYFQWSSLVSGLFSSILHWCAHWFSWFAPVFVSCSLFSSTFHWFSLVFQEALVTVLPVFLSEEFIVVCLRLLLLFLLIETILVSEASFVAIIAQLFLVVVCDVTATVLVNVAAVLFPFFVYYFFPVLFLQARTFQSFSAWISNYKLLSLRLHAAIPLLYWYYTDTNKIKTK